MVDLIIAEDTDLQFSKFVDGKQVRWDASSLGTFLRCPRLYQLNTLEGWRYKGGTAATNWGHAVHAAFEAMDLVKHGGGTKDQAIESGLKCLMLEYGDLKDSNDNARNLDSAMRAVVWRAEEFWNDHLKIATLPDGKPALEVRFEATFPGTEYRFSGRIDKMAILDNMLYIVDTKTTKAALTDFYFKFYNPDTQIYAYNWVCRRVLGLPVAGFIIDAVQTGVNFTRFARMPFNVTNGQLDEWERDVRYQLEQADRFHREQYYPANFASCSSKGGCIFQGICNTGASREMILSETFERKQHEDLADGQLVLGE